MKAKTEDPSFDVEALAAEIKESSRCQVNLLTTRANLAALAVAAKYALLNPPAGDLLDGFYLEFLVWCHYRAGFGPETRKLIGLDEEWVAESERSQ